MINDKTDQFMWSGMSCVVYNKCTAFQMKWKYKKKKKKNTATINEKTWNDYNVKKAINYLQSELFSDVHPFLANVSPDFRNIHALYTIYSRMIRLIYTVKDAVMLIQLLVTFAWCRASCSA